MRIKRGGFKLLFLFVLLVPSIVFSIVYYFDWPIEIEHTVSLHLGESWKDRKGKWYRGHLGEDVVVPPNTSVYAAGAGEVVTVKNWPVCNVYETVDGVPKIKERTHGWAGVIIIKHVIEGEDSFDVSNAFISDSVEHSPKIVYTQYGHLGHILVKEGDDVSSGDKIAETGDVCDWPPHLHFEIFDEDGFNIDRKTSSGAGFGYSGVDNHAPHRYIPQVFIENNKTIEVPEVSIPVVDTMSQNVIEKKQKISFIKRNLDRLSTFLIQSLRRMLSAVPSPEQQEQMVNTSGDVLGTQTEEGETPVEPLFDARFVQREVPVSFVKGAKQVTVSVEVENTGTAVWEKNTISLNVVGGRAPNAMWYHPSWVTQLRPVIVSQRLESGQKATVSFTVTIPEIERRLRLQLVRTEGVTYVQVGTALTTIVLNEAVVPPPKPTAQPIVSPVSRPTNEDIQTENTTIVTPFVDTPSLFVRTGGGGRSRDGEEVVGDDEDTDVEEEIEVETPTSTDPTPTSTDPTPTSTDPTPTSTPTSTDPLPELSDLSITNPADPLEVVYTNESGYIFAGTSDEYTETIVVTKDDVVLVTTTPVDGIWEIPVTLATGTQSLVLYGTASEERQTNSTTIIVVYDAEAPFVDIQLLSVGEGSIVVDMMTYDDSPIERYEVEFFEVIEYFTEPTECGEGLFAFEAPALQYYLEGDDLYVEIVGTDYGCGLVVGTQTAVERVVSAPYDESYSISVRAKGVDVAGNESDWWYSSLPLAFPDPGDVSLEL